jgi:hypothetical protein
MAARSSGRDASTGQLLTSFWKPAARGGELRRRDTAVITRGIRGAAALTPRWCTPSLQIRAARAAGARQQARGARARAGLSQGRRPRASGRGAGAPAAGGLRRRTGDADGRDHRVSLESLYLPRRHVARLDLGQAAALAADQVDHQAAAQHAAAGGLYPLDLRARAAGGRSMGAGRGAGGGVCGRVERSALPWELKDRVLLGVWLGGAALLGCSLSVEHPP